MGQKKISNLHIVTDIKDNCQSISNINMPETIRWSSDAAEIEALGKVKVKELPSFLIRNASPASLVQRFFNWTARAKAYHSVRPHSGSKMLWYVAAGLMIQGYATTYYFTPRMQHHQWRKYH